MNLSKASVKGLGTLVSTVLLVGTATLVVNPMLDQRSTNVDELKSLQVVTEAKKTNLERLTSGTANYAEATKVGNNFLKIIPKSKNIESASRAISEALVPGVVITSFNFSSEEAAVDDKLPEVSLEPYTPPASFVEGAAKSAGGSKSTLNRLPMTITVSADNYQKLSAYLNKLSTQNRLLTVISVSAGNKEGKVGADIYAFAYIDKAS